MFRLVAKESLGPDNWESCYDGSQVGKKFRKRLLALQGKTENLNIIII